MNTCLPNILNHDLKIDCPYKSEEIKDREVSYNSICFVNSNSLSYLITNMHYAGKLCSESYCPVGQYLCHQDKHCIAIDLVCDGIHHCYFGDDEYNCGEEYLI